jgi:hypothetical protein
MDLNRVSGHMAYRIEAGVTAEDVMALGQGVLRGQAFRHHRLFSAEELLALARAELGAAFQQPAICAHRLLQDGRLMAVCASAPLSWDSAYFGLPMARIDLWGEEALDVDSMAALLSATIGQASAAGLQHFSCHVEAEDYALFNALGRVGFALVDAKRIYVARRVQRLSARSGFFIPRRFQADDTTSLLRLFAQTRFESRYTRDSTLPPALTRDMYRLWMENLLALPEAERDIYVIERDGEILAAGVGRYRPIAHTGIRIMTDGVYAGSPRVAGSYISIINALVAAGHRHDCALVEVKVSLNNRAANRVLQHLRYEEAGQFYALHKLASLAGA